MSATQPVTIQNFNAFLRSVLGNQYRPEYANQRPPQQPAQTNRLAIQIPQSQENVGRQETNRQRQNGEENEEEQERERQREENEERWRQVEEAEENRIRQEFERQNRQYRVPTPKENKSIDVVQILPTLYEPHLLNKTYNSCKQNEVISTSDNEIVEEIENEELKFLRDPSTTTYKTLYSMLLEVGTECKCNFIVIAGHGGTCISELQETQLLRPQNNNPTVVLVTGCHTAKGIGEYNTNPKLQTQKFYFFGFDETVHMINGMIIMCKKWSETPRNMTCRPLVNDKQYEQTLKNCCKARWGQIKHQFIRETLVKRECSSLTKDNLVQKIKSIQNADGSFKPHSEIPETAFFIALGEGTQCKTNAPCVSADPFKKNANAGNAFNENVKLQVFIDNLQMIELEPILKSDKLAYFKEEIAEVDNALREYFKDASTKPFALEVFNFKTDNVFTFLFEDPLNSVDLNLTPFYFKLFLEKYDFRNDILERFPEINWLGSDANGEGLIHYFVKKIKYQYKLNSQERNKGKIYITYTVKELYRLFLDIFAVNKEIFWMKNIRGYTPFITMLQDIDFFFPLLEFYFKYFPPTEYDYKNLTADPKGDNALHIVLKLKKTEFTEKVVQFLLASGLQVQRMNASRSIGLKMNDMAKMVNGNLASYNVGYASIKQAKNAMRRYPALKSMSNALRQSTFTAFEQVPAYKALTNTKQKKTLKQKLRAKLNTFKNISIENEGNQVANSIQKSKNLINSMKNKNVATIENMLAVPSQTQQSTTIPKNTSGRRPRPFGTRIPREPLGANFIEMQRKIHELKRTLSKNASKSNTAKETQYQNMRERLIEAWKSKTRANGRQHGGKLNREKKTRKRRSTPTRKH